MPKRTRRRRPSKKPSTEIIERKLANGDFGICHENGLIEIDPRQPEDEFLDTAVHELLHRQFPWLTEEAVRDNASMISESLWDLGYRRIKL